MVVTVLIIISWKQAALWQNDIILFEHALKVTSGNYLAHNNLVLHYMSLEKTKKRFFIMKKRYALIPHPLKHISTWPTFWLFREKEAEAIYHYEEQ